MGKIIKDPNRHSKWSLKKPLFIKKDDKRYKRAVKQLKTYGFAYDETWALDSVICQFVLPRLICFREVLAGYPVGFSEKQWREALDQMIFAFDWSLNNDEDKYKNLTKEQQNENWKRYEEGMNLFAKRFRDLWW